jgi:hypothetical protein
MTNESFRDFDATELFCPRCRKAVPVKKRLLIILAAGDKYDYTCAYCGISLGDKTVTRGDGLKFTIE